VHKCTGQRVHIGESAGGKRHTQHGAALCQGSPALEDVRSLEWPSSPEAAITASSMNFPTVPPALQRRAPSGLSAWQLVRRVMHESKAGSRFKAQGSKFKPLYHVYVVH
jgi:hypothetical protein